jgi:hypothetical protein
MATVAPRHRVTVFIGQGEEMLPFGRTRDLSTSGAFLETDQRPAVGTERDISVVWGKDTVICRAKVVRHDSEGIGVAFVNPPMPFQHVLNDIIDGVPRSN